MSSGRPSLPISLEHRVRPLPRAIASLHRAVWRDCLPDATPCAAKGRRPRCCQGPCGSRKNTQASPVILQSSLVSRCRTARTARPQHQARSTASFELSQLRAQRPRHSLNITTTPSRSRARRILAQLHACCPPCFARRPPYPYCSLSPSVCCCSPPSLRPSSRRFPLRLTGTSTLVCWATAPMAARARGL